MPGNLITARTYLVSHRRIQIPSAFSGGIMLAWADMFVAFSGAVIILILFGGFYRARYRRG